MMTNLVKFYTPDGICLHGLLFEPEEKTNKILIHVHGSAGNFYENVHVKVIAETACTQGVAVLSFNNRGAEYVKEFHCDFNGKKTKVVGGFMHDKIENASDDIQGAINFAETQGFNDAILCGHSLGTQKVLHYVLNNDFDGKIILLAPFDTQLTVVSEKMLEEAKNGAEFIGGFFGNNKVSIESFNSIWQKGSAGDIFNLRNFTVNKTLKILKNEILIAMGGKDFCYSWVNIDRAKEYFTDSFENCKVEVFENGEHSFMSVVSELAQIVGRFIV